MAEGNLRLDQLAQKALDLQDYVVLGPVEEGIQVGDILVGMSICAMPLEGEEILDCTLKVVAITDGRDQRRQCELLGIPFMGSDDVRCVRVIAE